MTEQPQQQPPPPGEPPAEPQPEVAAAPPGAPESKPVPVVEPQPEPELEFAWSSELGPTFAGVPVFTTENPYGGLGLGILAGIDLAASHEANQPSEHPGTDTTPERPMAKSGGAAHYVDLTTGKAWTVAIAPEEL